MKKLIIIFMTIFTINLQADSIDNKEFCKLIAELSEAIMLDRQHGATIIQVVKSIEQIHPDLQDGVKKIVIQAFDIPIVQSEIEKQNVSKYFGNHYLKLCNEHLNVNDE